MNSTARYNSLAERYQWMARQQLVDLLRSLQKFYTQVPTKEGREMVVDVMCAVSLQYVTQSETLVDSLLEQGGV